MKWRLSKSTLPVESDDSSDPGSCPESCYDDNETEGSVRSLGEADPRADEKEVEQLARRETIDVRVWRLVVLAAMVGTATMVSTGAYIFLRKQEHDDFVESVSTWYNGI
jgi:hypothetical protein